MWLVGEEPLQEAAWNAIGAARRANSGIYVSAFTAWEVGTLVAKSRVQLTMSPENWFDSLLAIPGVRLAELTPRILLSSTALPGTPPNDPADRIIAATARAHGYILITRDRPLLSYAQLGHLRAIEC
jgi:PIN domain nuclease of toxin-antitoxin system